MGLPDVQRPPAGSGPPRAAAPRGSGLLCG